MLDLIFRKVKEKVLHPMAKILGRYLHPNWITLLSFLFGLAAVWFSLKGRFLVALAGWILNRVIDGIDGTVARLNHKQSDFGGYLDIVLDFVIYAAIPAAIVYTRHSLRDYLFLSILLGFYYVNAVSWLYLAAILEKKALGARKRGEMTTVTMPAGLVGGTETIIFYCLFFIFPGYILFLFSVMSVLIFISIIQRLVWAYVKLKE